MNPPMTRLVLPFTAVFLVAGFSGCASNEEVEQKPHATHVTQPAPEPPATTPVPPKLAAQAAELARRFIIVDGHVDLPYRLNASRDAKGAITEKVSERTPTGHFDYPRAVEGGLDAPFMSIYIPAEYQEKAGAKKLADSLIDMVEELAADHPTKFALASSPAEVRANFKADKISLPLGIENGAAIEGELANLTHFHGRGVRYITLTHSKDNRICDSSYAETHTHKGLSPFGRKVVAEMNRLGIMIDVSHVSDQAFEQVMELSRVPVIASHSSLRHFVPKFERNMSDEMIKTLAAKGGVVMINFGSYFLNSEANTIGDERWKEGERFAEEQGLDWDVAKDSLVIDAHLDKKYPPVIASLGEVADHIDRVVKLVGFDHVGLGSDFDGVSDLPSDLKDASQLPNLIRELLKRGYTDDQIEKICSGNLFRVWEAVERYAMLEATSVRD